MWNDGEPIRAKKKILDATPCKVERLRLHKQVLKINILGPSGLLTGFKRESSMPSPADIYQMHTFFQLHRGCVCLIAFLSLSSLITKLQTTQSNILESHESVLW